MLPYLFLLTYASPFAIILFNVKMQRIRGLAMPRRLTTEEFIEKARAIHGDKYDYSKVEYVDTRTDVVIVCPIHGEFPQKPVDHISRKRGCPQCGVEKSTEAKRKTVEEFIKEAKATHGDYYDYSKVEYVNTNTDVVIICPVHGEFTQIPSNHLKHGCRKCGLLKTFQSNTLSHEEQAAAILKVNPNIEILGKITGDDKKVSCRCLICRHVWEPRPYNLKNGEGCPVCAKTGFLSYEHGRLYIMVDDLEVPTLMKVGVSINPEERKSRVLKSAKKAGASFSDLHILKTWEGTTEAMHTLEKAMHQALSQYKINFTEKFDGCQEFFYYRPEVFELIEEHLKKFAARE